MTTESETRLVIEPFQRSLKTNLRELWIYRELFYFLSWRDIKVRYKQTAVGVAWVVLQPIFAMIIFSIFFGRLAQVPSDGVPYPVFTYTALIPWTLFSYGLLQAANSLIGNTHLITKVYFPRIIIPASSILSGLLDFGIAFGALIVLMLFYRLPLHQTILTLPIFILLAIITTLGVGIWFAAVNVKYRDVKYVVPFFLQFWLFMTPIAYSSSLLDEPWRTVYGLNPMAGVVEGFRWALLGTTPSLSMMAVSVITAVGLFISGLYYFQGVDHTFADVI